MCLGIWHTSLFLHHPQHGWTALLAMLSDGLYVSSEAATSALAVLHCYPSIVHLDLQVH